MKRILRQLQEFWCIHMHTGVMWPFKGHYRCRTCLREYAVGFEAVGRAAGRGSAEPPHIALTYIAPI